VFAGGQVKSVEAEFKRPLLMPGMVNIVMYQKNARGDIGSSQVKMRREKDDCNKDIVFCVEDATTQEPHVRGTVTIL
jgi:hypothetical protein